LHRENFDNPVSFGSESYSKEELIAEMTAAMLCGIGGIEQRILENSAAYLKTWIALLKSDSRLLVSAASATALVRQRGQRSPSLLKESTTEDPLPAGTLSLKTPSRFRELIQILTVWSTP